MPPRSQLLSNILALVLIAGALGFLLYRIPTASEAPVSLLSATSTLATSTQQEKPMATAATTVQKKPVVASVAPASKTSAPTSPSQTGASAQASDSDTVGQVQRINNPYTTLPESSDTVNAQVRGALVNILCLSRGSVRPISGSGVIIDPRGVILTNAHVAQYVLLSENPSINLSCTIRIGSPARDAWSANVLYIPRVWVTAHVAELNTEEPKGTGEHDYALLLIDASATSSPLPIQFPFLSPDTRNAIGFQGDQVLVASYPAEFLGGLQAENALYANSSLTTIGSLLTFGEPNSADVISLGGVIEAQSGSSGGAIVNPWGRLIALIATTSQGTTTASRDLRAITFSYINSDLQTQTGSDLNTFLQGDLSAAQKNFDTTLFPDLMSQYVAVLQKAQ